MGYIAPVARAAGFKVGSARWNADVVDNVAFQANPPAVRLTNSADQSIAHLTQVLVTFNTETYDTDSMHSTVSNTGRITFNTAGIYLVTFSGRLTPATDYTSTYGNLRLNGTTIDEHFDGTNVGGDAGPRILVATQYKVAASDYLEILVYHRNGAAAARNLETGALSFSAIWLGLG